MDDTICRTTEVVQMKMKEFAKKKNIDVLDIINDIYIKELFFNENVNQIYNEVEIKRNVKDVIRRLRNKGNQIYIITARSEKIAPSLDNVNDLTLKWLEKNDIVVDGIFSSAYGEKKADVCINNNIDIMIDDDPYNYKMLVERGMPCILFDDRDKYNPVENYAKNWLEVEELIAKMR